MSAFLRNYQRCLVRHISESFFGLFPQADAQNMSHTLAWLARMLTSECAQDAFYLGSRLMLTTWKDYRDINPFDEGSVVGSYKPCLMYTQTLSNSVKMHAEYLRIKGEVRTVCLYSNACDIY